MAGTKSPRRLRLITINTPKGQEVQIFVEELKAKYDFKLIHQVCDVRKGFQKSEEFLKLNPNGKIPVLIDNNHNALNISGHPFCIMESPAIVDYLSVRIDKKRLFSFTHPLERCEMEQWITWGISELGYMTDECIHFLRYAPQGQGKVIEHHTRNLLVAYHALERHLSGPPPLAAQDYIAGCGKGTYSIADMVTWPSINVNHLCGLEASTLDDLPHVKAWFVRIGSRRQVISGSSSKYETAL
ncbi:hypothetical protein PTTG_29159 [Puccinia triticina 1-1 BBBD Race 1]|uniref:Glutathione S-transferase n=1 Tax=Puccinia triticina (isolate 1-1 / race 1 (BBBD)) TaxID=630390 RepID=A0A180G5X9_PUCT1|nr:hypothetical protein PTTG_29159 [Puccinia triticina 1-1 BBBD Race 1]